MRVFDIENKRLIVSYFGSDMCDHFNFSMVTLAFSLKLDRFCFINFQHGGSLWKNCLSRAQYVFHTADLNISHGSIAKVCHNWQYVLFTHKHITVLNATGFLLS